MFAVRDNSVEKDQKALNKIFVMDHLELVRQNHKKAKENAIKAKREDAEAILRAKQEYEYCVHVFSVLY